MHTCMPAQCPTVPCIAGMHGLDCQQFRVWRWKIRVRDGAGVHAVSQGVRGQSTVGWRDPRDASDEGQELPGSCPSMQIAGALQHLKSLFA